MCELTAPPTPVFLASPWDAPALWLVFCVVFALLAGGIGGGVFLYRVRIRTAGHLASGRIWLAMCIATFLCLAAGIFLVILVLLPSALRQSAWFDAESARLARLGCDRSELFAADTQAHVALQSWTFVEWGLLGIAAFMLVASALYGRILIWRSRRT